MALNQYKYQGKQHLRGTKLAHLAKAKIKRSEDRGGKLTHPVKAEVIKAADEGSTLTHSPNEFEVKKAAEKGTKPTHLAKTEASKPARTSSKLMHSAKTEVKKAAEKGTKPTHLAKTEASKPAEVGAKLIHSPDKDENKKTVQTGIKPTHSATTDFEKTAETGARVTDGAQDAINKVADRREQASEQTEPLLQKGLEAASQDGREATDQSNDILGFPGQNSMPVARQPEQNGEAVTRLGTFLTQAFQDVWRSYFEVSQTQWQRNLVGVNKLVRAKSLQDLTAIQSTLVQEGLQHMLQDSRHIAATSLLAVYTAGSRTFFGAAQPENSSQEITKAQTSVT